MPPALTIVTLSLSLAATLSTAGVASGQVLEVGEGGVVTLRSGPAVTTDAGVTPLTAPSPVSSLDLEIVAAARAQRVDERLVKAVALQESGLNQGARSPKGAVGVMQLMPATASALGVDASDLRGNLLGGTAYLSRMLGLFGGDVRLALAAYNAGPGAVLRYGGLPPFPETQTYVRRVLARAAALPTPATGAAP